MSTQHVEALEQAEYLRQKSDENMFNFFKSELLRINSGERATSLLNSSVIKNLTKFGILEYTLGRGRGSKCLVLTNKALDLLESR